MLQKHPFKLPGTIPVQWGFSKSYPRLFSYIVRTSNWKALRLHDHNILVACKSHIYSTKVSVSSYKTYIRTYLIWVHGFHRIWILLLTAVHRTLIDACRTMLVWGADLIIYYAFDKVSVLLLKRLWILQGWSFVRCGILRKGKETCHEMKSMCL